MVWHKFTKTPQKFGILFQQCVQIINSQVVQKNSDIGSNLKIATYFYKHNLDIILYADKLVYIAQQQTKSQVICIQHTSFQHSNFQESQGPTKCKNSAKCSYLAEQKIS
eukprot:TRINITY_DN11479_c0_g1_i1.p5 TRINITY_DN11479_c0_g1~~TRINITY_DN11479_c0_g1_i1.p5  ORF type:complete len:109 (+),score=1.48 TRINITY_DN11479_c0_g1_i1:1666-1992(+)